MVSPYKIALIVLYFGPLPPYFPVWLKSAEANPDVDFLVWSDQDIRTDAPNFRVTRTTLDELRRRFERTLNRSLQIPNGYKLCDYRPAFGLLFEEELRGYDFWGHCDVDLMFGQIRRFLTDEVLDAYDRFYAYGPLSVYRNSGKMNHAFELPGSWFTLDEMFAPVHVAMDEDGGINRICVKNRIPWYTAIDFVQLSGRWANRLEVIHGQQNYSIQAFYYLDGRVFHRYLDGNIIKDKEVLYIHWYRKKPVPERRACLGEAVIVAHDKLLVRPPEDLTSENMLRWNPSISRARRIFDSLKCTCSYWLPFFTGNLAFKKIWLKKKRFLWWEVRLKKLPYL